MNLVESWVEQKTDLDDKTTSQVNKNLQDARQIESQDVEEALDGSPKLRKGVAKDRRISIEDEEMRHGRKSRSQKVDGYKRHVLKDLELEMVRVTMNPDKVDRLHFSIAPALPTAPGCAKSRSQAQAVASVNSGVRPPVHNVCVFRRGCWHHTSKCT